MTQRFEITQVVDPQPVRFEFARVSDFDKAKQMGADGWQLVNVVAVGENVWHYLERPAVS